MSDVDLARRCAQLSEYLADESGTAQAPEEYSITGLLMDAAHAIERLHEEARINMENFKTTNRAYVERDKRVMELEHKFALAMMALDEALNGDPAFPKLDVRETFVSLKEPHR